MSAPSAKANGPPVAPLTPAQSASIRRKSFAHLAARSSSASFSYLILGIFIFLCSPYWKDHRFIVCAFLAGSLAMGCLRYGIARSGLRHTAPEPWGRGFTIATLAAAAFWGGFCVFTERLYGYSWTAWITYFCTAGLCSGAVNSLSSSSRITIAYLGLMLMPGAASLLLRGGPEGWALSLIFLSFMAFLCVQARHYDSEFRQSRENEERLESRTLDLIAAKESAEESSRIKSAFLTSVGHELRTPLNSVIGFSRILLKNKHGHLDDRELKYVETIHGNGARLLSIIEGVLGFSRLEAGRMDLREHSFDLAAMLRGIASDFQGSCRAKGISLRIDLPEGDAGVFIHGDEIKLAQVVLCLIDNAVKFTHEGAIRVGLGMRNGHPLFIEVADTGIGIPADKQASVFEAFRQADEGTSRAYGGTGLGLALARSLATAMGHTLDLASRPGEGSTFRITLCERNERSDRGDGNGQGGRNNRSGREKDVPSADAAMAGGAVEA